MSEALRIRLRDVLYRTRGRDWDYAFLLQPIPLIGEGWYTLHRRIFANVEPDYVPVYLRGQLGVGLGQPFFAVAFTDPARRDSQARPIAHYLVWLGAEAEAAPGVDFGPGLVQALAAALDTVFGLTPEALPDRERPLDARLRQRFQQALSQDQVALPTASAARVRWLGTVAP